MRAQSSTHFPQVIGKDVVAEEPGFEDDLEHGEALGAGAEGPQQHPVEPCPVVAEQNRRLLPELRPGEDKLDAIDHLCKASEAISTMGWKVLSGDSNAPFKPLHAAQGIQRVHQFDTRRVETT